jgi:hypothetical protein
MIYVTENSVTRLQEFFFKIIDHALKWLTQIHLHAKM